MLLSKCNQSFRKYTSSTIIRNSLSYFDLDTALTAKEESSNNMSFNFTVSDRWNISEIPNGGYMAATAISACRKVQPFHDPLSLHAHYVGRAISRQPMDIECKIINIGKNLSTVSVNFVQNNNITSTYLLTLGDLNTINGPKVDQNSIQSTSVPNLPSVEDCFGVSDRLKILSNGKFTIFENVEIKLPKDSPGIGLFNDKGPQLGNKAYLEGWMRFTDKRQPCLRSNALFLDAFFPPIINVSPSQWVPTLSIDMNFWGRPSKPEGGLGREGWVRGKFLASVYQNGLGIEEAEIWDADEPRLLASSRQLFKLLNPR